MMISRHSQTGSALIISLLILLVMTMLGVASMSSSSLEEKMAANDRNQKTSLRNSELALQAAEFDTIDQNWSLIQQGIEDGDAGYHAINSIADPQNYYLDDSNWVANTSCIPQAIDGINSCYAIEHVYDPPTLNPNTYGGISQSNMSYKIVKVTSYATDESGLSSSKTQAHIKKTYLP